MKSEAPAFIPRTARSTEPQAVMSTTGTPGCASRTFASSARPSSPLVWREKFMSCNTSSGSCEESHASASDGPADACDA